MTDLDTILDDLDPRAREALLAIRAEFIGEIQDLRRALVLSQSDLADMEMAAQLLAVEVKETEIARDEALAEIERLRAENANALEMIDEWRGLYRDTDPKPRNAQEGNHE